MNHVITEAQEFLDFSKEVEFKDEKITKQAHDYYLTEAKAKCNKVCGMAEGLLLSGAVKDSKIKTKIEDIKTAANNLEGQIDKNFLIELLHLDELSDKDY